MLGGEGWDAYVQTYQYRYNAFVRSQHNILRYDNTHTYPGHADPHHKHTYDPDTGARLPDSPHWIGQDDWPTLGEVIEEVERWYWEHRAKLDNPEGFPDLEARG